MTKHDHYTHPLKKDIIVTQLTNFFVGIFGSCSYETLTFNHLVPLNYSVQNFILLDHIFNASPARNQLLLEPYSKKQFEAISTLNESLLNGVFIAHVLQISLSYSALDVYKPKLARYKKRFQLEPLMLICLKHQPSKSFLNVLMP